MSPLLLALALVGPAAAQDSPAQDSPAQDSPAQDSPAQDTPSLDTAYQKEFAFLRAEKESLQGRVTELAADREARLSASEAELDRLQGRLLALTRQADGAEDRLDAAQRASDKAEEGAEVLASTLSQAAQTLGRPALVPVGEEAAGELDGGTAATAAQADALARLFEAAAEDLGASGSLTVEPGAFFGPDGQRLDGEVISLGHVGRYGVAEAGGAAVAGPLVPAGEDALRIADGAEIGAVGPATATALAAGELPAVVGLHTYESLRKRVDERAEKGLAELMAAGGLVGWVIVGLGALALLLAAIRAGLLLAAGRGVQGLTDRVAAHVQAGRMVEGLATARSADSAAGRVQAAVLGAVLSQGDRSREYLEGVGSEALLRELPALERFQATLRVIAAVAPLLGLLGTVTGMIGTFELITEYGTGDPKMLSTGISQALVTTQLGLVVAIPVLLVGNVLKGRADQVVAALETGALGVLNAVDTDAPTFRGGAPGGVDSGERAGA